MFCCFGLSVNPGLASELTFLSATPLPEIQGASAIELDAGGRAGIVLSDRGSIFRIGIDRAQGQSPQVNVQRLPRSLGGRDLEGLAIGPQGSFVAMESPSTVMRLATRERLPTHPAFEGFRHNKELEALAIDSNGALIAIGEGRVQSGDGFPVFRFDGVEWEIDAYLPQVGLFRPVGADIGPDGWLYILERGVGVFGFRSRILRADPAAIETSLTEILITAPGRHDNLEGLTVWQSDSGATCLTLVSDDNFSSLLRAEIVEYALTETLAPGMSCD